MAFQNITFKHTNSNTDSRIHDFVTQKLQPLTKYVSPNEEVRCEVEFERESQHKSGLICRVEVNIWVAGILYRSEALGQTFEAAVDIARDDLDEEMRKAHKKRHSLLRRGGRKIKDMMRFGQ